MNLSWQTGVAILDSALLVGSAVYALRQRAYRPQAALFAALYGVLAAGWALLHILVQNGLLGALDDGFTRRLPDLGLLALAALFWLLTRVALGHSEHVWVWALLEAAWLGAAIAAAAHVLPIPDELYFAGGITVTAENLLSGWIYLGLGLSTLASALLALRYLRQTSRYFTVSSYWVIVLLVGVVGDLLYLWRPGLPGLALRSLAGGLAMFVAASPRIPEVSHVLRHWLNRLLYTVLAFLVFLGLFALAGVFFSQRPDLPMLWIAGGLAIIGALLVDPLLFRGRRMLRRWLTGPGEPNDTSGLLRQYSQSITNILDLNLLATVAVATAAELLDVKRGFVFLVDHEKDADGAVFLLRGVKGMGDTNPQPARLSETSPLAAYFRYEYKPITQSEIDTQTRFKDLPAVERLWLDRLGVEVFSPIYAKNEWIGLLALGAKGSGRAFSPREMSLLATISDQTAVALENIRLVEGLMRLNNDFRRSYSALDQANRSLERLDKTKSDFISIASHELRTPITLISGSSQMLLDDPELQKNPYYKQMLTKLAAGAQRLHEIVDSMLDAAKIDTRALDLEPQPVSLYSLVQSVVKDLKKEADERKQTIELQDLEDLPPVAADQPALKKAFFHLLINAIKYTPDGGAITVTGQKLPPDDDKFRAGAVQVTVADSGIGIDPRFQELIFTKFYQTGELALHSTGKTKFKGGGPGLGLYITRGIVEAHRGKIWVESPGYSEQDCPGSKFHVALPLKKM